MALTIIPFLFKIYMLLQPNQGSIAGAPVVSKQKSSYQNYFLQADFSLSEKLHRNRFGF
jgi:iron complex outermembrane receptor protein